MGDPTSSQVMLLRRGKLERTAIAIDTGQRRPRYGETLNVPLDGGQVHAKIVGVWRPPWPAPSVIYMINADEIE
jgi:hypothetical protein